MQCRAVSAVQGSKCSAVQCGAVQCSACQAVVITSASVRLLTAATGGGPSVGTAWGKCQCSAGQCSVVQCSVMLGAVVITSA